jgi:hypothetical protein
MIVRRPFVAAICGDPLGAAAFPLAVADPRGW